MARASRSATAAAAAPAAPATPPPASPPPAPAGKPFDGEHFSLCGQFNEYLHTQTSLEKLIKDMGGVVYKTFSVKTTAFVCPEDLTRYAGSSYDGKVGAATRKGLPLLSPQWLIDCEKEGKKLDVTKYTWPQAKSLPLPKAVKAAASKKRSVPVADGTTTGLLNGPDAKKVKSDKDLPKEERQFAEGQFIKKKSVGIPLDEGCPLITYQVYIEPDTGLIWDASLNQSNSSSNANKFYRLQIVHEPKTGDFKTWSRWGRVGEHGQSAVLGNGGLDDAIKNFQKKFKDKSGLAWENRGDDPKPKKYAFVERSYNPDSDDDDEEEVAVKKEDGEDKTETPECTLEKPIQDLMELIFNQQYFQQTMSALNYDANKLPLGKLSKTTITRGFQQLKDLAALMDDPDLAKSRWDMDYTEATEHLSNTYYSLIPHEFGRNRPPVISDDHRLKKEIELLESLSDMKDAADLMKIDRKSKVHPTERQFLGLGMEEMTTLDHKSNEFKMLAKYLNGSRGATHHMSYNVQEIFRIERNGETKRFDNSPYAKVSSDRRLLWHGSRATNFGGILSQGLRIAPPEAPVSGYMFGKGIYLADMSSKSAGYCCAYNSGGEALLLLCEAELGDPMQKLTGASYQAGETAKQGGMHSTWGLGRTGPKKWVDAGSVHESLKGIKMPNPKEVPGDTGVNGAGLMYNEYICYDVAQVKLRYLFRVKV